MTAYAAFLRGITPTNAKMPAIIRCFESAGFSEVKTVLASGNVVFASRAGEAATLERRAEKAMTSGLGRTFLTFVRPISSLAALLAEDPFASFQLPARAKRVVSFLREPPPRKLALPIERDGARILKVVEGEVFSAYVPSPKGPVFMQLITATFGDEVTTRTWDTIRKVVAAASR